MTGQTHAAAHLFLRTRRAALQLRTVIVAAVALWMMGQTLPAAASVYTFSETSTTEPGFVANVLIDVAGGLSALPTISNATPPGADGYDFGALAGLAVSFPGAGTVTSFSLSDFVAESGPFSGPIWIIRPTSIQFIDRTTSDDFTITLAGANVTVAYDTDGPSALGCNVTGACVATGALTTVPEPSAISLYVMFLALGVFFLRPRAGRSSVTV